MWCRNFPTPGLKMFFADAVLKLLTFVEFMGNGALSIKKNA
jgi:hypothetical protein